VGSDGQAARVSACGVNDPSRRRRRVIKSLASLARSA
jgi:hypothetical protein